MISTRLDELAPELLLTIFRFLGLKQLVSLTLVNHQFKNLIGGDTNLWRDEHKIHFLDTFKVLSNKENVHWPSSFKEQYKLDYKSLPAGVPAIFSLVKENDVEALSLIPLNPKIFFLKDRSLRLIDWILIQKNPALSNYAYQTIKQEYVTSVESSLIKKFDVAKSISGDTLLGWTIVCQQPLSMVKNLIKNGCDLNSLCFEDFSPPLVLAARHGQFELVFFFVNEYPQLLESVDGRGQTALLWAAAENHLTILRFLISKNANLEAATHNHEALCHGYTALCWASEKGHAAIVDTLLTAGANAFVTGGPDKHLPIHLAIIHGHIDIVRTMLKHNRRLINAADIQQHTCLALAFHHRHADIIKLLFNEGAILDKKCILTLLESTDIDLWDVVLGKQPQFPSTVSIQDGTVLSSALERTFRWAVKLDHRPILNWIPITNEILVSAIKKSISEDNFQFLTSLLTIYPNVKELLSTIYIQDRTLLLFACNSNLKKLANFILDNAPSLIDQYSASPIDSDKHETPLISVVRDNNEQMLDFLLARKPNPFLTTGYMQLQAIHIAARKGNLTILKMLLDYQPDLLNQRDKFNRTPLIWATENGHEDVVRYLIQLGADLSVAINDPSSLDHGKTALDVAFATYQDEIEELFLKAGCTYTVPKIGFFPAETLSSPVIDGALIIPFAPTLDHRLTLFKAAQAGNKEEIKSIICNRNYSVPLQSTLIKLANIIFQLTTDNIALQLAAAKALLLCAQEDGPLNMAALDPYKDELKSSDLSPIFKSIAGIKK